MDDFPYRIGLLYRHNLSSLIMKRAVQADGEVTSRLIDETFHVRDKARCRDSETCWTHGESPFGSHHIKSLHYGVVIIHRLAHSHKDKIGKVLKLRQMQYLVKDVASREVSLETLFARLTEEAVHLAAHLTRHTQRSAFSLRDIRRLDKASACRKQIFLRTVSRLLHINKVTVTNLIILREQLPRALRQVRHLIKSGDTFAINPVNKLFCRELRKVMFQNQLLKLSVCHSK